MIGLPIGRAHPWQKCTDPLHLFAFLPMIYSQKQVDDKTKLAWAKPTHLRPIQCSSDVSGNKIGMNSAGETEKGFGKNIQHSKSSRNATFPLFMLLIAMDTKL